MTGPLPNSRYTVTADKRRGTLSLEKGQDDLLRFCWRDRATNATEIDRIVFPDEGVVFKRVNTGRGDADRVYMLKYAANSQPLMFWMQDKSADKDAENCTRMNELINNPAAVAAAVAALAAEAAPARGAAGIPGGLDPAQWMQLMG